MSKRPVEKLRAAADAVQSFTPTSDFRGKPFGPAGPEVSFKAGIPSAPVPVAWIESLSAKKTGDE